MLYIKKNKNKGKSEFKNIKDGSAKWSELSSIKPFVNDKEDRHILIIGGSETDKIKFFTNPNLMRLDGSYIVIDPKGSLIEYTGDIFLKAQYDIIIFNLKDTRFSMKYNPFFYINTEFDILHFANFLMKNTKGEDDFWVPAERTYLQALIAYMMETQSPDNQNIEQLLKYINMGKAGDDRAEQEIDKMFEELNEVTKGDSFAVGAYQKFKLGVGNSLKSILISVYARMSIFDTKEDRNILSDDELITKREENLM